MDAPTLIDLNRLATSERTHAWARAVPSLFPGLTVDGLTEEPTVGMVKGASFGATRYWIIDSGPASVAYSPVQASLANQLAFSLMLQLEGTTEACQRARLCRLQPGDFCLIDNDDAFQLHVPVRHSKFVVLQLPRASVLGRHPQLHRTTAIRYPSAERGVQLLKANLMSMLETAPALGAAQQWAAQSGLIQFLGLLEPPSDRALSGDARVQRALAYIEAHLSEAMLSVDDVALDQAVSRRQLDRLFASALGTTVTAHLWERRLAHAAELLQGAEGRSMSVTQVALASGFQDVSHFCRAFKKRYRVQPGRWRKKELM